MSEKIDEVLALCDAYTKLAELVEEAYYIAKKNKNADKVTIVSMECLQLVSVSGLRLVNTIREHHEAEANTDSQAT